MIALTEEETQEIRQQLAEQAEQSENTQVVRGYN